MHIVDNSEETVAKAELRAAVLAERKRCAAIARYWAGPLNDEAAQVAKDIAHDIEQGEALFRLEEVDSGGR